MFVCFYLTVILVKRKIFPKNGKRMKMVQNFGNLVVQELPYHLKYRSFGLLMPVHGQALNIFSYLQIVDG